MRVLFWGTPEFAIPTLRAIARAGHAVVGVVTRPDRPRGRGRKPSPSPVRSFAGVRGYPVLTPEHPRGDEFLKTIRAAAPDISVVVAYGCILPRSVLDAPVRGSINVHASLLPVLRGAAPVNRAVARGHRTTGVTVMRMVEEMDAGPILAWKTLPIGATDTAALVSRRLSELGASLLAETLSRLEAGGVEEVEQDHAAATYAPKVDRASARVDWTRDTRDIACLIRGMDDVPGAWTMWNGRPVKVFGPQTVQESDAPGGDGGPAGQTSSRDGGPARQTSSTGAGPGVTAVPGRILTADPRRGIVVATGSGAVRIAEVLPPGKSRMASAAWVRGRGPRAGDRFE